MASGMTKTQLVRNMAEKLETNNKTAAAFLEHLAETAIKETKKNGVFIIPGIGREVESQSAHGPQPADRRTHQDCCENGSEVPRSESREGLNRSQKGLIENLRAKEKAGNVAGLCGFDRVSRGAELHACGKALKYCSFKGL